MDSIDCLLDVYKRQAHRFMGTYPAGTIRFSVNYFTSEEDFEQLIEALDFIEENL